jgi:AcrR family transcriptional regulator
MTTTCAEHPPQIPQAPSGNADDKREQILQVAEALCDQQGYTQTTIGQIVGRLGVTKPFV